MGYHYPDPGELGLQIPATLNEPRFHAGFEHGLRGQQLACRAHLKQSFREGFRASKLFLRDYRRAQGILEFPMKAHFKMKVAH